MRTASATLALVLLSSVWATGDARADGMIVVTGGSARQKETAVAAFTATAKAMSWSLAAPSLSRDAVDAISKCLSDRSPWTCLAPDVRRHEQVVLVQLENDRTSAQPQLLATAHVLIQGNQAEISDSRYSDPSDEEAFKRSATALSNVLRTAAERTGRTTLVIRSRPDKAWITLDGQNSGVTEKTRTTYPGLHTISLRRIGYKAIARDVVVVEGKVTTEDFELEPDGTTIPVKHQDAAEESSAVWPKLVVAAGAAAVAGGIVWLYYDEDVNPVGPQKKSYHDTARYGYVSLAAGGAAVGVGLYFWLRPSANSSAVVTPQRGGVVGGWMWNY